MEDGWNAYAKICNEDFQKCSFKSELLSACIGYEDIAWAVYYNLQSDALSWLKRSVPALNGETPASLLATGKADAVRSCLWQMP
jgi:hypothetical protein